MSSDSDTDSSEERIKIKRKNNKKYSSATYKEIDFKQDVKGYTKQGSYTLKSNDPKKFVMSSRLGEGSKSIYDRSDFRVKFSPLRNLPKDIKTKESPSTSAERPKTEKYKFHKLKSISPPSPPPFKKKQRSVEKEPYFNDPIRERDRLKQKYGRSLSRSPSRDKRRYHKSRSPHSIRTRKGSSKRSKSRSPRRSRSNSSCRTSSCRYRSSSPVIRHRRSCSHSNHRSYYHSPSCEHYRRRYRTRSRSRSTSRSRSRRTPPRYEMPPQFFPVAAPYEYPPIPPPGRWLPPHVYPRYPVLIRPLPPPPIYQPVVPYFSGIINPVIRPQFRGRPNRSNYCSNKKQ